VAHANVDQRPDGRLPATGMAHRASSLEQEQVMAFRSRQVSRRNNGAIDSPANARWTSHETGQVIMLMGRGVECRSTEILVIDESGGPINENDD
jgi:hypothetical protein